MIFLFNPESDSPPCWYRHIENEEKSKPIYETFQYLCTKKYVEEVLGIPFEGTGKNKINN
ncbi:MAG: hypothetical protein LIP01_04980 [Tannerellaceae bacterium]|nr:hypothetical protein [Tannerellaceae bacterium]